MKKEGFEIAKGFVMLPRCIMEALFIIESEGLITYKDISIFIFIASESISWKKGRKKYLNGRAIKLDWNQCLLSYSDIETAICKKGNISRSFDRLKSQGIISADIPNTNRDKVIYTVEVYPHKWAYFKPYEVSSSSVEESPSESEFEAENGQRLTTEEELMLALDTI